jgi:amino acid adenylation domain-containing protein
MATDFITDLVSRLVAQDVYLFVEGAELKYRAKKGTIQDADRTRIREHKTAIIEYLCKLQEVEVEEPVALPTIPRVERDAEGLALSYAQRRLWFVHQYMGPNAVYNIPLGLRLRSDMDAAALVRSLEELHRRHESLRTRFESVNGSPVQVIDSPGLGLQVEAVSAAQVAAIAAAERGHCFDLSSEPLCRIRLLQEIGTDGTEATGYVLLVTMHHSVSDGWSLGIFLRELMILYRAYANGEDSPLAPLPIQYADYAQWQRRWLQGAVLEEQLSYWREQLQGLPPLLTLPTDRPRPSEQTFRGRVESFALPLALTERLRVLSREQGVTLFMTLLSGWSLLLSRYSGQTDVAVGTPVANRTRRETEALIGFFVNMLVLRADLRGDPRFVDLLKQTREVALQGYAHQDVPFELLVEELNPQRTLSHSSLFQVSFGLVNTPADAQELPGFAQLPPWDELAEEPAGTTRFDMTLNVRESVSGLVGELEYNTDLFDRQTIRRLLDHYARLLEAIVTSPRSRLSHLQMLSDEERHRQLVDWNATARPYPQQKCIHELFEEQARLRADAIALVHEGSVLTYSELNRRANTLAHELMKRGVGPEVRVGLCAPRSVRMVIGILGILKAGGCYVPLDPDYPRKRLEYLLEDAQIDIVVTEPSVAAAVSGRELLLLTEIEALATSPMAAIEDVSSRAVGLHPEHPAYLIYTSASTGAPKGVLGLHRGIVNRVHWLAGSMGVGADEVLCQKTSVGFVDHVAEIFQALSAGVSLVILSPALLQAPDALLRALDEHRVTQLTLVPSLLKTVLEAGRGERARWLKCIYSSGEALHPSGLERFTESFPRARLFNIYGSTEMGADATCQEVAAGSSSARDCGSWAAIGKAIANTQAYILDGDGQLTVSGAVGELSVGGVCLSRGYFNRAGLTAEKFVPNAFARTLGERLYRTGDLARWLPDGTLEYMGRADTQVKVRGFRIELGEIESALLAHESVRDAVVVAREDLRDKRLVGYVVAKVGVPADEGTLTQTLLSHLQEQLPGYMLPSTLMVLDRLPLTASGKVDRKTLPAPGTGTLAEEYDPPQGEIEVAIANIWQDLLPVDRVGRQDNFFGLGGHSLLAVQVSSRIQYGLGVELPLSVIFNEPTLAALAQHVERSRFTLRQADGIGGQGDFEEGIL